MAEMWTRTPIMQGKTEQNQLFLISKLCGSIVPEVWPDVESLELYGKIELTRSKRKVITRLQPYVKNPMACDLIDKLLCLDPSKRYDTDLALNHDFFWTVGFLMFVFDLKELQFTQNYFRPVVRQYSCHKQRTYIDCFRRQS